MRREKAMTKSVKRRITNILLFVILSLGAVLILFPIAWMLSTALKSAPEIAMYPPKLLPEKLMFENFAIAWSKAPFTRYTINTLIIVFFTIIGNILVNSFVAYGFAKIDFAGKKFLFNVILATMMIPGFVTLVPTYVIFSKLQWVNTYLPLIVPAFCGNAFHIFMMRQFYRTIPNELMEAARVDGANKVQTFVRIVLPLVMPGIVATAIYTFINAWNEFLYSLILINSTDKMTVSVALKSLQGSEILNWGDMMAASALVVVPSVIFFMFIQNKIAGGMTDGAVK